MQFRLLIRESIVSADEERRSKDKKLKSLERPEVRIIIGASKAVVWIIVIITVIIITVVIVVGCYY